MQQNECTDELILECLDNDELDGLVGKVKNIVGVDSNNLYEINEECEKYIDKLNYKLSERRKSNEIKDLVKLLDSENTTYIVYKLKLKLSTF
jgi:hypothetical protein